MQEGFFRSGRLKLAVTVAGAVVIALSLAPVGASSANISHSYKAAGPITDGSLVSLDPAHPNYVQPANIDNGSRLLGVALASGDSLLAVDATPGAVQVATSGSVSALVSTIGGNINLGDQIGVSPFNGVGMKATSGSRVVGLAQTTLNDSTATTTQTVTDKQGKTTQVKVGLVRIGVAIGVDSDNPAGSEQLTGLQKIAKSITGHTVSTIRVLVSLIVVVVSLLALVTLIYASIYGSIISVGRNPLAKYAIFRTLGSVLGMAALTTVVTAATLFLLLR